MAGGDLASPAKEEREMAGIDVEEEDGWATADASECGSESDDTEGDPTFDVLELTRSKLSKMSLRKSRPRIREVIAMPQLNTKEKKCFETVEKMIKDGELDKLKLEECKLYLRKYGLRLTGNKNVLQARIKEHLEVMDGGGEKKYPVSSFVLNCKGDACMGDVVMFEQNVYDMYNVASRSATAPPCGTRTVAGRIVKESYGAAKQQHTFTVEVLWSKGEKPLPPLHPLLIKGRNLYRLKTMRQRWEDEEERNRVLQEKHRRGSIARSSREVRIQGKEMKNMTGGKRRQAVVSEKNVASGAQNTRHQPLTSHKSLPAGAQNTQHQAVVSEKSTVAGAQNTWHQALASDMRTSAGARNILHQALVSQNLGSPRYMPGFHGGHGDGFADRRPLRNLNSSFLPGPPPLGSRIHPNDHQESGFCRGQQQPWRNFNSPCRGRNQNYADVGFCSPSKGGPQNLRRHPCRWHLQGRCWYGENCRYQH